MESSPSYSSVCIPNLNQGSTNSCFLRVNIYEEFLHESIFPPKKKHFPNHNMALFQTHTIHGTGIFTYISYKNQPNVGIYTVYIPYMDGMGRVVVQGWLTRKTRPRSSHLLAELMWWPAQLRVFRPRMKRCGLLRTFGQPRRFQVILAFPTEMRV